ncbi:hypothetical protein BEP19_10010 [Ammoniphilus oxalaticus]|uniref:HTH cro/C1-type domain-containing protein n=1 Tax=Ammoniphilus oxalaticus TaxID=66863 RepID=A0A419SFM6_9BACL|nr:helix-turn-helix transcriptional regulator [Ammoniphilus oxalaticus]RKD22586.1 hypothetical protein BEP19_10010 [Ammoniphilus oxalaticus]
MSVLGKRLKKARESKGLTQLSAAKKLGISNGTLSGYERNYRDPDTAILDKMAELYEVNVDWLLGRTDDPGSESSAKEEFPFDPEANLFFYEFEKLSEEDKQKAIEHIKFLQHMAKEVNKKK